MSKTLYTAEYVKTVEMVYYIDIEASSEEEAWSNAEAEINNVSVIHEDEWERDSTDTNLSHVTEV